MKALRMWDVELRGCLFTLYPAAEEKEVNQDLMYSLLKIAQEKFVDEIPDKREDMPLWPTTYSKKDIQENCLKASLETLIQEKLLKDNGDDTFSLTEKALDVFYRAKEINDELKKQHFFFCPCCF